MYSPELIFQYFPELTEKQKKQFGILLPFYQEWNQKINLVSRQDISELYLRHVLHSLSIAKIIHFKPGTSILDVGTGGGFPGIPLAILFPEAEFKLIDSIGKKIKVVQEVIINLGLSNVNTEQVRAEAVKEKYDFVVSRAVTRMKPFYQWVRNNLRNKSAHEIKNGILALKGGDLSQEMQELYKPYQIWDIGTIFQEDFFKEKKLVHVPV